MELLVIAVIAFVIAIVVRRKEALLLRWQPTRHTWAARWGPGWSLSPSARRCCS